MDPDVTVTIGIPVYNAGRNLKYAIDSVLAQSYRNFEVLIIIDGATDNSADIAGRYTDPRIRVILSDENKGISYRINQQVQMAKGCFFARMDADDIMFPERIREQVKFMLGNPDIDVVGSQAVVIDGNNKIIGFRHSDTELSFLSTRERILFIHPTVFGRTDWFRKNPYPEDLAGVEDYYLWNMTYRKSGFFVLDIPLMFYRDPPEIHNRIYLIRQRQMRRALVSLNRNSIIPACSFCKLYVQSVFKTLIYEFLWKINQSGKIVSGRNIPVPPDKMTLYYEILESLITSDHT